MNIFLHRVSYTHTHSEFLQSGIHRCQIIKYSGITAVPILTQILAGKFFCYCSYTCAVQLIREYSIRITPSGPGSLKFCHQPSKNMHLAVINFDFPITIGPVTGFPSKCTDVNYPHSLSNCVSLDSSSLCCLKRSFSVALAAILDCNLSFPHFVS